VKRMMLALAVTGSIGATSVALAQSSMDVLKQAESIVSGPLTGMLESQLGVTSDQAAGGLGSLLTLASERLAAGDFDQLASLVPGASGYMETAKKLGAVTGPLSNVAGLNSALGRLGMSPETVAKFAPTVADYLGKVGGEETNRLLASVLKPG
jgi:Protein of unknown function VcgC/VcgE (DUF2780)